MILSIERSNKMNDFICICYFIYLFGHCEKEREKWMKRPSPPSSSSPIIGVFVVVVVVFVETWHSNVEISFILEPISLEILESNWHSIVVSRKNNDFQSLHGKGFGLNFEWYSIKKRKNEDWNQNWLVLTDHSMRFYVVFFSHTSFRLFCPVSFAAASVYWIQMCVCVFVNALMYQESIHFNMSSV